MFNSFRLLAIFSSRYRRRGVKHHKLLVVLLVLCPLAIAGGQTLTKYSSTISITIRAFTTFDSSAVKDYAAVLYDTSGTRIDSLVALDTNLVRFLGVPITGVRLSGESPTGYFLGQNYPNPFNPSSRMKFTLPEAGPVSLKTYTVLGQEDASFEMMLGPGNYEVQYNPGGAAGIIFYRLMTKDFVETKKMIQFGGDKSGKSKLALVSSGIQPRSQQSSTVADIQVNNFIVRLYNLPSTYLPIKDTTIRITGLMRDTTLTVYVAEAKGLPCPGTLTVTYADRTYNTVLIGTQCWLKENLDVGTVIQGNDTAKDNGTIEKYCYNNDTASCSTHGGLYQWNEAMQYATIVGSQGICPAGWHIPTLTEFQTLAKTVGYDGNALKAIGQGIGTGAGTNTSGFSALLAGWRSSNGTFDGGGYYAAVWSSTEFNAAAAYDPDLGYLASAIYLDVRDDKNFGFSVRCLKD